MSVSRKIRVGRRKGKNTCIFAKYVSINPQAYIENVSRLTGIDPDDPLGSPSDSPARWMMVGAAMAIQENGLIKREQSELVRSAERENGRATLNGTSSLDYFAMLRGWEMSRE